MRTAEAARDSTPATGESGCRSESRLSSRHPDPPARCAMAQRLRLGDTATRTVAPFSPLLFQEQKGVNGTRHRPPRPGGRAAGATRGEDGSDRHALARGDRSIEPRRHGSESWRPGRLTSKRFRDVSLSVMGWVGASVPLCLCGSRPMAPCATSLCLRVFVVVTMRCHQRSSAVAAMLRWKADG
jgi:hypothetical protein